jgi:hypothetical protein
MLSAVYCTTHHLNLISVQDICVAEELVKQGYATWEKGCKEELQRIVGKRSQQPQTALSEDVGVSPGKGSDEGVDPSDGQNTSAPENCKKIECVVGAPEGLWGELGSEGALEMG